MADKPGAKAPPETAKVPGGGSDAGHYSTDDRGNVTWEWKKDEDLLAEDTLGAAERMRALVDSAMDVLEDDNFENNPAAVNAKRMKTGYNPYNSGALGKQTWARKRDMRELSKWIELRKKMGRKSDEGEGG